MISITDGLQAIYNSNMREKTPLELEKENRELKQQLDQLTNNWNELEETIRKDHEKCKNIYDNFERSITAYTKTLLDKMKEIKEKNNV